MSQDTENTPDTGAAPDPTPEAAAEKAKRERASYPIRLMRKTDGGYGPPLEGFATIDQAERWVRDSGEGGATYLLARVIGAREVVPRQVREVPA